MIHLLGSENSFSPPATSTPTSHCCCCRHDQGHIGLVGALFGLGACFCNCAVAQTQHRTGARDWTSSLVPSRQVLGHSAISGPQTAFPKEMNGEDLKVSTFCCPNLSSQEWFLGSCRFCYLQEARYPSWSCPQPASWMGQDVSLNWVPRRTQDETPTSASFCDHTRIPPTGISRPTQDVPAAILMARYFIFWGDNDIHNDWTNRES